MRLDDVARYLFRIERRYDSMHGFYRLEWGPGWPVVLGFAAVFVASFVITHG